MRFGVRAGVRIANVELLIDLFFQKALLADGKRGMEKCKAPCFAFS